MNIALTSLYTSIYILYYICIHIQYIGSEIQYQPPVFILYIFASIIVLYIRYIVVQLYIDIYVFIIRCHCIFYCKCISNRGSGCIFPCVARIQCVNLYVCISFIPLIFIRIVQRWGRCTGSIRPLFSWSLFLQPYIIIYIGALLDADADASLAPYVDYKGNSPYPRSLRYGFKQLSGTTQSKLQTVHWPPFDRIAQHSFNILPLIACQSPWRCCIYIYLELSVLSRRIVYTTKHAITYNK